MKAKLGCIPCIVKQAANVACLSTEDPRLRRAIVDRVMEALGRSSLELSPAEESNVAYEAAARISGNADPYSEHKRRFNRKLLDMYGDLKALVEASDEPLRTASRLAIAGNMIDLGIGHAFDLEADLKAAVEMELAVDDYPRFSREVARADRVLLVADNAGEIVLDRLLVETMGVSSVTVAVREAPIINDATVEDAREIGLDKVATIITTGNAGLGIALRSAGSDFREAWQGADLVISKGQANFETLDAERGNIFFLLKAKCDYVARELGVRCGEIVLAHRSRVAVQRLPRAPETAS